MRGPQLYLFYIYAPWLDESFTEDLCAASLHGMSQRSRNLPRRSCLSTPGSSERFLAKAPT